MRLLRVELEHAIRANNLDRVIACLHANVEVNYNGPRHCTPLILAIQTCRETPAIVAALIMAGAAVDWTPAWFEGGSVWEDAPLAQAVHCSNLSAFRVLLEAGADVMVKLYNNTPLLWWLRQSKDPLHQEMVEVARELAPEAFLDMWMGEGVKP